LHQNNTYTSLERETSMVGVTRVTSDEEQTDSAITSDALFADETDDERTAIAENQLYDFITNTPVKDTPAERLLQAVARALVDEYGFEHTQLTRDQLFIYETFDAHGKPRKQRVRISIAVYPEQVSKEDMTNTIRICLVHDSKVKGTDPKRGVVQLEEILGALPNCRYGMWTNGSEQVYKQKLTGGGRIQPEYVDLYDLPGYGEEADDLDDPERTAVRIATGDNLQRTFARIHDYIYGNQGLKKDAAFWQVLNLIFCKIHDERSKGGRRFWVRGTERNTADGQSAIAQRIRDLFDEVKTAPEYANIFSERDTIDLNDRVLAYVVGELSRYNLLETDVDVKGAAYEEITSSMLKQQRGQFFTPSNVIRLMVRMMDPGGDADLTDSKNWPRMLDPAGGSGRFATYTLDHIRTKLADQLFPDLHPLLRKEKLERDERGMALLRSYAAYSLFAIDFDPDLKRAARMNMILNDDGHGNIMSFNSLEFPLMVRRSVGELREKYGEQPGPNVNDAERACIIAPLGSMDYIFTNPPFGAKIPIDEPAILEQYDLGHRWTLDDKGRWQRQYTLQSRVAPEVLFVERCVQWAKPGTGRIAIVLPDGILSNPDAAYIRQWILDNCQVLASVDLPVEAFLPQVGVQASLLFLRRKSQQERDAEALTGPSTYPVFMAIAETVGHDRRGNTIYVRDADGAEQVFTITKEVLRQRRKRRIPVTTTTQEKLIDDDLPGIGDAYAAFLRTGKVEQ
jgi:type I restriction enzyme M protein